MIYQFPLLGLKEIFVHVPMCVSTKINKQWDTIKPSKKF